MFGKAILENEKTKILVPMQYKKGFIYYRKCVEQIFHICHIFLKNRVPKYFRYNKSDSGLCSALART